MGKGDPLPNSQGAHVQRHVFAQFASRSGVTPFRGFCNPHPVAFHAQLCQAICPASEFLGKLSGKSSISTGVRRGYLSTRAPTPKPLAMRKSVVHPHPWGCVLTPTETVGVRGIRMQKYILQKSYGISIAEYKSATRGKKSDQLEYRCSVASADRSPSGQWPSRCLDTWSIPAEDKVT